MNLISTDVITDILHNQQWFVNILSDSHIRVVFG